MWFLEVVITQGRMAAAGLQTQVKGLDARGRCHGATVWYIGHGSGQSAKEGLIIAEGQVMVGRAVLEVVVQAIFLTQPLDEIQVGFVVLHAVLAGGQGRGEVEAEGVAEDAVVLEYLGDDLRYGLVLEDALVEAMAQVGQLRYEDDVIVAPASTGITLADAVDLAVNTRAAVVEGEKALLVQQLVEVQVRAATDQFQFETVGLADGFTAFEGQHLEFRGKAREGQGKAV